MFRLLIRKHVIVGLVTGDLLYHKNQIKYLMNLRIAGDKYFNVTLSYHNAHFKSPLQHYFKVVLDHSISRRNCLLQQAVCQQSIHFRSILQFILMLPVLVTAL